MSVAMSVWGSRYLAAVQHDAFRGESAIRNCADVYDTENADMHYMYGRTNGTSEESFYGSPFGSGEDLVPRISEDVARVREIPSTFEGVRQSLHRRYHC
ncbi:hypothetical protein TNCV_1218941 [Trichonephila clavipes]|nr:hypothetical protein TNCV_1218941 [Trichonephila clavipes]